MKTIFKAIGAAAVALVIGFTSLTPAVAAPVVAKPAGLTSNVELAQYYDDYRPRWKRRHDRRHYGYERRHNRHSYWNGHRGYREHRRYRDGLSFGNRHFRLYIE
ncbi:hypothetical protein [Pararhizobium sp.]|uniref:hypothetical protein n=1 Tax=Pararhizobium sp. TaxID=1977563 RepID=UPI002724A9B8|nr:hypothetical protein [Pararhizobium sp.]MDO9415075.1 hypothetical protein [Pararhizobium sp.]